MRPLVIGHRGAAGHAQENTADSFRKAVDLGVDWVEFDIRESQDGEFFVIHDSHLGRISSSRAAIRSTNSTVLSQIELHSGQRLLTLSRAFELVPQRVGLMVEIKAMKSHRRLVKLMQQLSYSRTVMLTSFDLTLLSKLQACSDQLRLGVVSRVTGKIEKARKMGLVFLDVCLDYQIMTAGLMSKLQGQGLRIYTWTVDREKDMRRILNLSPQGIITNYPDLALVILKGLKATV